jgi:seryl-tRNA synthetase
MGLLQRLTHDLKAGFATLRHGTAQAAIRALQETELLRIRLEIRKLDEKLEELYRDVGERAISLGEGGESAERVLYDAEVGRLVKEIQELKETRDRLESEVAEIRSEA